MSAVEDIVRQVHRTIADHRMIGRGELVVVAVSGGPDSVVLLSVLWRLRHQLGIQLHVAHLDHGLRGKSSRQDAGYVRRLAKRLGLPVTIEHAHLDGRSGRGLEEEARLARYAFLDQVVARLGAERIATGHTADDQAETVLMRLIRGAGSEGLSGIPPVRGLIVRPLIEVRRSQILEYLRHHRLRPRYDETNRNLRHLRNRVRARLLPLLERDFNPNIVATLCRLADLEREESDYFQKLCGNILSQEIKKASPGKIILDLSGIGNYFNIAGKYLIRELIRTARGDLRGIERDHVEKVYGLVREGFTGRRVHLPGGWMAERAARSLILTSEKIRPFCQAVRLPGVNKLSEAGWVLTASQMSRAQIPRRSPDRAEFHAYLDQARLRGPFVLRTRRRGDRFSPLGLGGSRKLSDYFIDRKVPRSQRDEIPLLVGRDGIIWVVGYGIADPFKVTGRTRSVLRVHCARRSG